jgi:translocator protein
MSSDSLRRVLNVVLALAQPASAVLASLRIGGPDVGEVAGRYPTFVVPAGYAFSIWGLIYALSLGYAVLQALPARRADPLFRQIGWWTAAAFLSSTLWTVVFRQGWFAASVSVIFVLLVSLVVVVRRIGAASGRRAAADTWLVHVTFGVYLGWVTVATIANVAQALVAHEWGGWGLAPSAWGVIVLVVAAAVATAVILTQRSAAFGAAVVWALVAVAVNQWSDPLGPGANIVDVKGVAGRRGQRVGRGADAMERRAARVRLRRKGEAAPRAFIGSVPGERTS